MKRIVRCPQCGTKSRIGPLGQEDKLIEVRGKLGTKGVLHCTNCSETFLGRLSLVGAMRTWELTEEGQRRIERTYHKASGDIRRHDSKGDLECPHCGKCFVQQSALDAHQAAKHLP